MISNTPRRVNEGAMSYTWEFPLLDGYRIPFSRLRPYVEAGWAPRVDHASRILSGLATTSSPPFRYEPFFQRDHTNWATTSGVAAGGGVQIAAGRLQLSPEVRYTH